MEPLVLNGKKSVIELVQDPSLNSLIEKVIVTSSHKHLIDECRKYKIPYEIKPKDWFNHQKVKAKYKNVLAYLKHKPQLSFDELIKLIKDKKQSLIVFLDKLQDPYNFGAILRTCAACNVDAVLYSKHEHSPMNSTVLKASQGYCLKVKLVEVTNLKHALNTLQKYDYWSYSTSLSDESKHYAKVKYAQKSIIIFGNEGDGVSHLLNNLADAKVLIPLYNNVDSLNVSVSVGVMLYEYLKQMDS